MNAFLFRQPVTGATRGILVLDTGDVFHTLERPWRDNRSNVSSIPQGRYKTNYLPRSASGKYRKVYHLKAVPARQGILIHHGNLVSHTRGCILLGLKRGVLAGQQAVLSSKAAMRKLNNILEGQDLMLTIAG